MTTKRCALVLLLMVGVLGLLPAAAVAHECTTCPSFKNPPTAAARNLASLAGCWVGQGPNGVAAKISYEIGSGGSSLIEKMWVDNQKPVMTVYHLDGDTMLAEHFCSLGNQVRMRSEPVDAKGAENENVLTLRFFDATNRTFSPTDSHMTYVKFDFSRAIGKADTRELDVEWGLDCGDVETPQPFTFTRSSTAESCEVAAAASK
jgi:hypothetical protein